MPPGIDLESAETVGEKEVEMEYPDDRDSEKVARLCPYCERPFTGKHGVMIHLGQTAGRKNHPENPKEIHEPEDFAIVRVDEKENVIETVEEGTQLPTTERRQEREKREGGESASKEEIREHIEELREKGLKEEADKAERLLLRD